jgi:hypothetical protein
MTTQVHSVGGLRTIWTIEWFIAVHNVAPPPGRAETAWMTHSCVTVWIDRLSHGDRLLLPDRA